MAIWQAVFYISLSKNYKKNINNEGAFLINDVELIEENIKIISSNFLEEKSWDKDTKQFGILDSTCMELTYYEDGVEISCRIDLRNITKTQIETIIEFVLRIDGVFVCEEKEIVADYYKLIDFLKKTDAAKFCKNPVEFIRNI